MAIFSTEASNLGSNKEWFLSLPPEAQKAYGDLMQLQTAKQNLDAAKESGGRVTEQQATKAYQALGGDAALNSATTNVQTNFPDVYNYASTHGQTTGGLGQGGDILGALAAMGGAAAVGGGAAGAGASSGAGTATGGGLTAGQAAGTAAMAPGYVAPAIATPTAEALAGTTAAGGLGSLAGGASTAGTSAIAPNTLASLIQGGTALAAGEMGANAADKATEEMRRQFDIGQANVQPWMEAGKTALTAQQDLMGLGAGGPEAQLSSLMSAPGYQFRLKQGQKGLEASSAARGGMGSGKALTAATQYGQDYASNEYGNRLNQLAGLSGTGQTQANQSMQAGMNYAGDIGNASLIGSQSRQSGITGAGSALSNYLNPQPKQLTLADLWRMK